MLHADRTLYQFALSHECQPLELQPVAEPVPLHALLDALHRCRGANGSPSCSSSRATSTAAPIASDRLLAIQIPSAEMSTVGAANSRPPVAVRPDHRPHPHRNPRLRLAVGKPAVLPVDPAHQPLLDVLVEVVEPHAVGRGLDADDRRAAEHQDPRLLHRELQPEHVTGAQRRSRPQPQTARREIGRAAVERLSAGPVLCEQARSDVDLGLDPQECPPLSPVHGVSV